MDVVFGHPHLQPLISGITRLGADQAVKAGWVRAIIIDKNEGPHTQMGRRLRELGPQAPQADDPDTSGLDSLLPLLAEGEYLSGVATIGHVLASVGPNVLV